MCLHCNPLQSLGQPHDITVSTGSPFFNSIIVVISLFHLPSSLHPTNQPTAIQIYAEKFSKYVTGGAVLCADGVDHVPAYLQDVDLLEPVSTPKQRQQAEAFLAARSSSGSQGAMMTSSPSSHSSSLSSGYNFSQLGYQPQHQQQGVGGGSGGGAVGGGSAIASASLNQLLNTLPNRSGAAASSAVLPKARSPTLSYVFVISLSKLVVMISVCRDSGALNLFLSQLTISTGHLSILHLSFDCLLTTQALYFTQ
jgi:hypothetical protein